MPIGLGSDLTKERLGFRYVVLGAYVYGVRRVNSMDLLRQGLPTLEGSQAYAKLLSEHERAIEELDAGLKDPRKTDEERAEIRKELAAKREARHNAFADSVFNDKDKAIAYIERCRAYVCAMVQTAGRIKPEHENINMRGRPFLAPGGWDPKQFCEDLRTDEEKAQGLDPIELAPFRFVLSEDEAAPGHNVVWINVLDQSELTALGTVLMGLQEVAGSLTATFRSGSGAT